MFTRWWSRKLNKPLSDITVPDLDREVAAHWGRDSASPNLLPVVAAPDSSPSASLDFHSAAASRPRRTRERSRLLRRLVWSALGGLLLVATVCFLLWNLNLSMFRTNSLGERMTFGVDDQEEIYYTAEVSPEQAQRLGAFLQREGIFDGLRPKSVRVTKNAEVYVVGFVLEWNNWQEQGVADDFRDLLPRMARGVFDSGPVEIHLCARQPDSQGRPMPTMRIIRADAEH
ncbi:MAG TPA: hypothetical protein VN688_26510 [Gemmataceae bacterium]|nr:hypothetical protein [Gemmataceae bacterium]